jgi:hypothetical protein
MKEYENVEFELQRNKCICCVWSILIWWCEAELQNCARNKLGSASKKHESICGTLMRNKEARIHIQYREWTMFNFLSCPPVRSLTVEISMTAFRLTLS